MDSRKIDEVAATIDDAQTDVEELQFDPDTEVELEDLHDKLERASETLDEIEGGEAEIASERAIRYPRAGHTCLSVSPRMARSGGPALRGDGTISLVPERTSRPASRLLRLLQERL
jgi:hypothetical protein